MSDISIEKLKQSEQTIIAASSEVQKQKEEESIHMSDNKPETEVNSVSIHTDEKNATNEAINVSILTQEKTKTPEKVNKTSEISKTEETQTKRVATNPIIFEGAINAENSDTFVATGTKTSSVRNIVEKDLTAKAKSNSALLAEHYPELMEEISAELTEEVYKENDIQEALTTMKEAAASQGINWDNIPSELKIAQLELILQHKTGKISDSKFAELKSKYNAIFTAKMTLHHLPKDATKIDREKVKASLKEFAKFSSAVDISAVKSLKGMTPEETQHLREDFIIFLSKHSEKEQKMIMEYIVENFPENCTEENAKVILEEAENYNKMHLEGLEEHVKNGGYSKKTLTDFSNVKTNVYKNLKKWSTSFIEKFWKSAKGRAIISYSKGIIEDYIHEKANAEAVKAKADEAKAEAQNAKKQAEIAMANAKKAIAEGKSIIARAGINPEKLNQQQGYTLLKQQSPLSALKCKRAYYAQKDAKHASAMADISAQCAQERAAWADKLLAGATARLEILMSRILS